SISTSPSHWLSECLCELMASPHVSMPPHGGMRLGPGPMDVFTTRFEQYFTSTAHGTICGHPVDREGLKEGLLALQKRWTPEDVKVEQEGNDCLLQHDVLSTELEFTPPGSSIPEVIIAQASLSGDKEGEKHIRFIKLEGNRALFR
ncbi:hypothetical protein BD309DRAFT_826910, partial [Dichomitus squalens]